MVGRERRGSEARQCSSSGRGPTAVGCTGVPSEWRKSDHELEEKPRAWMISCIAAILRNSRSLESAMLNLSGQKLV